MELRSSVLWFAKRMEEKLRVYDGEKPGWSGDDINTLFEHLINETNELFNELNEGLLDIERIIIECADVANLAMMIADNHNSIERGERE